LDHTVGVNGRGGWQVAFAKDQLTKAVKQADGKMKLERNEKRGGKRWLAVWIDPQGDEGSRAFETKARAAQYATWTEQGEIRRGLRPRRTASRHAPAGHYRTRASLADKAI
jgi:hypothetical protein